MEVRVGRSVYEALSPSTETAPDDRSSVEVTHDEGVLTLEVEADDPSSMRAALNTWLRLVAVAEETGSVAASPKA